MNGPAMDGAPQRTRLVAHFTAIAGAAAAPMLAESVIQSLGAVSDALRAAVARGDREAVRASLHKARGALLNGGFAGEASAAHALEIGAPGPAWDADLATLLAAIAAITGR